MFRPDLTEQEKADLREILFENYCENNEVMLTDSSGRFLFVSQSFAKSLGIAPESLLTTGPEGIVERGFYNRSASMLALKTKANALVLTQRKDGKYTIAQAYPVFREDGTLHYIHCEGLPVEKLMTMIDELSNEGLPAPVLNNLKARLLFSKADLVYRSRQMQEIVAVAERVAQYDTNTLILGESGVGKDAIARHIQRCSARKEQPFIAVNIAQVPPSLLESELFGYVGGAFTGANKSGKTGLFEAANGGTVFLDEIGDMPLELQVKILRVLENREIFRVGSNHPISLNIRIITATNKNLPQMIKEGTFREDLYYRLNVLTLRIPPLRERPDDIAPLIEYFLQEVNHRYNLNHSFSPEAIQLMEDYDWPGNVRSLRNFVEKAAIMTQDTVIGSSYTRRALREMDLEKLDESPAQSARPPAQDIMAEYSELKRESILNALIKCNGNKSKAAKMLNISRSHLYKLIREYQE